MKIEKHKENPFLQQIELKEISKLDKVADTENISLYDTKKKRVVKDAKVVFARETVYDRSVFIKIYDNDLSFIINLSTLAQKILAYIIKYKLEYNKDKFEFRTEDFCSKCNVPVNGKVSKAVAELAAANIIAAYDIQGLYWINPNLLFKGERKYLFYNDLKKQEFKDEEK